MAFNSHRTSVAPISPVSPHQTEHVHGHGHGHALHYHGLSDHGLNDHRTSLVSIDTPRRASVLSVDGYRRESVRSLEDQTVVGISPDQNMDDIRKSPPTGWKLVKINLRRIVEYGHREGILTGDNGPYPGQFGANGALGVNDENEADKTEKQQDDDVVKVSAHDMSLIHAAIPFLPVPVAVLCFVMNVIAPGSGTVLSGFSALCMGQPRLSFKEGRRFMTLLINCMVGIAQLGTITFLLVGWFWSMAWGGLMITHSLHYREALRQHRQEAVATAAIEALTRDAILRRRDVRTLVQERKQGQAGSGPDYNRRRSLFPRFGKTSNSIKKPSNVV